MSAASVLRSGLVYGVANVLSAGVPFLLLPILTRALDPTQYGEVVSFYLLVGVTTSIAGLSLNAAVGVRWLDESKGDPRGYTASAVMLVIVSTSITALLAAALGPSLGLGLAPEVCALAAVVAGATTIQSMRFAVWQSLERPVPAATLQVASACLNIFLSLLAVFALQLGGLGRILGATVAGMVVAAACVISLVRERAATTPSAGDVRSLLRFGAPLIPHALAGTLLTSADRFAVSAQLGTGALGIYGTASQLGMIINVLADAAVKAYTPVMYRLLSRDSLRSRLRIVAITYLSVPAWLLIVFALWTALVIAGGALLGEEFLDAIDLAIWFLLGGAVTGVYLNLAGLFFFTGKTEWISLATITSTIVTLLVVTGAVSQFGMIGGAATYLAAQLVLLAAAWVLSCRVKPMPWKHPALAVRVLFRSREGAR